MGNSRPDSGRRRRRDETEHGAVLAHSMGLGKTLTVIAFLHTALRRANNTAGVPYLHVTAGKAAAPGKRTPPTALVLVPKSVSSQWEQEFAKWLSDQTGQQGAEPLNYFRLDAEGRTAAHRQGRLELLRRWKQEGGVMIIVHDTFRWLLASYPPPGIHPLPLRSLLTSRSTCGSQFAAAAAAAAIQPPPPAPSRTEAGAGAAGLVGSVSGPAADLFPAAGLFPGGPVGPSLESELYQLLLSPGPDVLVVDEAHVLKNENNKISRVLAQVQMLNPHPNLAAIRLATPILTS
eukprot:scaffold32218_cov98-Isochrysis_galbana.AAC.1